MSIRRTLLVGVARIICLAIDIGVGGRSRTCEAVELYRGLFREASQIQIRELRERVVWDIRYMLARHRKDYFVSRVMFDEAKATLRFLKSDAFGKYAH
jgi:hypothetical protein